MIEHSRRTFLRAFGAGGIGALGETNAVNPARAATTITIEGGGDDIWDAADAFQYYYTAVSGDFDVIVKVTSQEGTDEWAKAGLMVRQTLNADAETAMVRQTPGHETSFQWRSDDGDQMVSTTSESGSDEGEVAGGTLPATWQRLVRDGDTIEAYGSTDGSNWTRIAAISPSDIDFAESAYVGLAVCSGEEGTLCTATFSNLSGISPASNIDVGDVTVPGSVSERTDTDTSVVVSTGSASTVASNRATVSGSLDDLGGASSATVSFEYRERTGGSWQSVGTQTLSRTRSYSEPITGLDPATDYEFRAVSTASDGDIDTGSVNTFRTSVGGGGSGVVTVEGGGADIWNEADEGHFYYAPVEGDFDVAVSVDSLDDTDEWAKTGLMVRESLSADAVNAMVRKTPGHETSLQWREGTGAETTSTTAAVGEDEREIAGGTMPAQYQRLVRNGDVIEAYASTDGSDWTLIAALDDSRVFVSDTAYVGLAVTSHNSGTLCRAEFSELAGLAPTDNRDIGDPDISGSVTHERDPGDADPVVSTGSVSNVGTHSATLSGSLTDLGGVRSVEVAFEYRARDSASWSSIAAQTLSSTGSFSETLSGLDPDTDYEFRAIGDASDGDPVTGSATMFSTSTSTDTAGGSYFDPSDGFADPAPWLDDSTQVIRIQNATRSEVERAFSTSGPRVIVFETSGTIDLGGEELAITEDKCWVAGQTAPSPGITFIKGQLQIDANDCVVQHIRSRHGPGSEGSIQSNDAVNTQDDTTNNVVDHVSASWGTDECMSVGYDTDRTTYTNCLIYEGLYDPYDDGADHNYGTLIGDGAENVALLGNVWAKVRGRVPRLKSGTRSALANNVMYFFNEATNMDGDTEASIVGNVYAPQDLEDTVIEDGTAYLADNVTDPTSTPLTGDTSELSSRPLWPDGLSAMDSSEVENHNLNYAGARPADRTEDDSRIISEIETRAGDPDTESPYDYWIPDHEAVGGYPQLPENTHSLTVPDSGLREWLEQWALAVETDDASPP